MHLAMDSGEYAQRFCCIHFPVTLAPRVCTGSGPQAGPAEDNFCAPQSGSQVGAVAIGMSHGEPKRRGEAGEIGAQAGEIRQK